jgi:hypothetical protein
MAITVVRIYDDFRAAEQARAELLRSGFGEASVHLTTREDEAGPMRGNFILPSKDQAPDDEKGFFGNLFSGGRNEQAGRKRAGGNSGARPNRPEELAKYGVYLLTVDAGDDIQYDRAADIMNRHGAFDVERTANRQRQ